MNQTAIFWPMLAHVLLVYVVYGVMRVRRVGSVRSGEARTSQFKVRTTEPASSMTVANNLMNQFELPVLFHVLGLALYVTQGVSYLTVALMWIFILTRYAHAFVHLGSNSLRRRSALFTLGALVLLVAWVWFAVHIAGVV